MSISIELRMHKKSIFERKADDNKVKGTYGYALMWYAVAFMLGFLPYLTNNESMILILAGALAFITGSYKLYSAMKKS